MSTDRDVTGIVRSWLDEGVNALPDRVLDAVLDQLPATPQRRSSWLARRFPPMNRSVGVGLAAAAVLIAAAFGFSYISNQVGSHQPTPTPIPSGMQVPLPSAGALASGTYFLANPYVDENPARSCTHGCSSYQRVTFTLPPGWATSDGLVYKHLGQPGEVTFSVWTVDQVYADPCHWQGSALSRLDLRNHTHDASGAIVPLENGDGGLAHQLGRGASALAQVMLGGVIALKIELSVPAALDISTCDKGEYRSWSELDVANGADSHNAPGQLDVVYMVDVDRSPLVIDASHMPGAAKEDVRELEAILASMVIER